MKLKTKDIAVLAMLSAIAYVVMALGRLPITSVEFLKYDPKDIIIVIGGFIFGPLSALLMSIVVSFVEMLTVSTSGPIGMLMNVISTCAFACVAAAIYKQKRSLAGAVTGLIVGVLTMTGTMLLWNYIITPIYMGTSREIIVGMLVPLLLPFNLVKGGLNGAFTMLLYKPLVTILRRSNMLPEPETSDQRGLSMGVVLTSLFVLTTCVLIILLSLK